MKQVVKQMINKCWIQRFGERRFDHEQFADMIVEQTLVALEDLKGYSGVGADGDPYDTSSWNAALVAAAELIRSRLQEDN